MQPEADEAEQQPEQPERRRQQPEDGGSLLVLGEARRLPTCWMAIEPV